MKDMRFLHWNEKEMKKNMKELTKNTSDGEKEIFVQELQKRGAL